MAWIPRGAESFGRKRAIIGAARQRPAQDGAGRGERDQGVRRVDLGEHAGMAQDCAHVSEIEQDCRRPRPLALAFADIIDEGPRLHVAQPRITPGPVDRLERCALGRVGRGHHLLVVRLEELGKSDSPVGLLGALVEHCLDLARPYLSVRLVVEAF